MSKTRVLGGLATCLVALLLVTASPAAAVNATASEHTTFGTGDGEPAPKSLTTMEVQGSGTSASVVGDPTSYNVVDSEADGTTDSEWALVGDDGVDNGVGSELRIRPAQDATIDQITVNISRVRGSDYGFTTDVWIIQEQPDSIAGEGTKVATWDPDFQTGEQTIDLSTHFEVTAGQDYSIQFTAPGTNNNGLADQLEISTTNFAPSTWMTDQDGNNIERYPDVTVSATVDTAKYVGAAHSASEVVSGEVDLTLTDASATVKWQEDGDGDGTWTTVASTTYSTSGTKSDGLSSVSADRWRAVVEFSTSSPSTATAELDAERAIFDADAPVGSNPSPTGDVDTYDGSVSLDVTDQDFSTNHGDEVNVSVSTTSGDFIGSKNVTSNQTVDISYNPSPGNNNLTWTLTDAYGQTDTVSHDFIAPDQIAVRTETEDHTLITGSDVTIKFFEEDEADPTIVRRSDDDNDGLIPVGGLSANSRFVITASANGYENRTVVIDNIFEQESIFLVNTSQTTVENRLTLTDQTGEFPPQETEIQVQKAINRSLYTSPKNDRYNWTTIAGDDLGADGAITTTLIEDDRYRIVVTNEDGDRRILGAFSPSAAGTINLEVGEVVAVQTDSQTVAWDATRTVNATATYVTVEYNDTRDITSTLYIEIYEDGNESNVLLANSSYKNLGQLAVTEQVPVSENDTSWAVEITAIRDGADNFNAKRIVGPQRQILGGLSPWIAATISIGMIWVVAGLFSQINGAVGGLVVSGMGGMFWFAGFIPSELGSGVVALSMITAGLLFINEKRDGGL